MSLTYASIDDAWGDPIVNAMSGKKKKKKPIVCSLYSQSTSEKKEMDEDFMSFYDDTEMGNFKAKDNAQAYERYSVQPMDNGQYAELDEPRKSELDNKHVESEEIDKKITYITPRIRRSREEDTHGDNTYVERFEENQNIPMNNPMHINRNNTTHVNHQPSQTSQTKAHQQQEYLDFGLYITSGIFLIFAMEQILQLGMKLK